jgi:hypothetical protein
MAHAGQPDEIFEVPGDALWAIIGEKLPKLCFDGC